MSSFFRLKLLSAVPLVLGVWRHIIIRAIRMLNTTTAAKISPNNVARFLVNLIGEDWMERSFLIVDREQVNITAVQWKFRETNRCELKCTEGMTVSADNRF